MLKPPLKTVIIGCGRIGALADTPGSLAVSTHAHAIAGLPAEFQLTGFVDPDAHNLQSSTERWSAAGFKTLDELTKSAMQADVFVIASPDHLHMQHLQDALKLNPQGVIVEKPVSQGAQQLEDWLKAQKPKIPILVNYTRRYMPIYQNFLMRLKAYEFGRFLHGSGSYSKGLFHSASHLLNAILPIFEHDIQEIIKLGERNDYTNDDFSTDALIRFQDGTYFFLRSVDAKLYELFEMDLFFERARIRIDHLGLRISYDLPKILFPDTGISYIQNETSESEVDVSRAFQNLYGNLYDVLNQKAVAVCDLQDSIKTLKICEKLR